MLEAARRCEIDVVLVWRLDRWGRSVADLLATLLAVFAEFEREILRKLCRDGASKSEIARRLQIGWTSVRRMLADRGSALGSETS